MASVMFGVITFFITHFLSYELLSPQCCLVAGPYQGALTPDHQPAGPDALYHPASRHPGRLAMGGLGCLRRLCCAGAGGDANSSPATARAQRIRSTAASGWSPNSWATRWAHPKPPWARTAAATAFRT
jgi:hypothetical protein